MERKLAALLCADAVGSTAAAAADEESAVARIAEALEAIAACAERHGGRVFSQAGDSAFVEFPSAINALRAAMEARGLVAPLAPMRFGLHLADVLVVGDDLRGDGVNVAARVQETAEPGAIDVTAAIYDHVRRSSPCSFEAMGERHLKGRPEPVEVYRVAAAAVPMRMTCIPSTHDPEPRAALRPNSVAVVRFRTAASADEDQSFLAETLSEDITVELSRIRRLFVSSPSAGAVVDPTDPAAGRRLGVRWLLTGAVRRLGPRLHLHVSLASTEDGRVVWSDRIQRPFDEVFETIDEIVARVAGTVTGRIDEEEIARARLGQPADLGAWETMARGLGFHRLGSVGDENFRQARRLFLEACELDEGYGRPRAWSVCAWANLPDYDWAAGRRRAGEALALDPSDAEAHRIMGSILGRELEFDAARGHFERAVALAPCDAFITGKAAALHNFTGDHAGARALLDRAEALDPFLPVFVREERLLALYGEGRFEDLLAAGRALPFQTRRSLLYRAAARVAVGDLDRARLHVHAARGLDPTISTDFVRLWETWRDRDVFARLEGLLVAAGLPQGSLPEDWYKAHKEA